MAVAEKTTLSQIVSERIKKYIIEHQLKPGDRLPSAIQLIDMLKVSRTVVRESLKSLESVGILKIRSGGGIYVENPSLKPFVDHVTFKWKSNGKKIKELVAMRKILELGAIELAISNYDLNLLAQMEAANRDMEQTIQAGKVPIEEDLAFHRGLFKATGNQVFYDMSDVLTDFFNEMREIQSMEDVENRRSLDEHKEILTQIRKKNVRKAKAVMTDHLRALEYMFSGLPADEDPCI